MKRKCFYVVINLYEYNEGEEKFFIKEENAKEEFYSILDLAYDEIMEMPLVQTRYKNWEWSEIKQELWNHDSIVEKYVLYYIAYFEDEE